MNHGQTLDLVRGFVRRSFDRFGANVSEAICESILIRDGHYCGRRFDCAGCYAVWFIEENEVKLYDRQGALLDTQQPAAEQFERLRAAA